VTRGQFESINRFTLIVKQFVQLLPPSSERQRVIEEIVLQEDTFTANIEGNCLPLKMFRDLFLQGGLGGFDVTRLLSDDRYVWLAGVLLNVRHLPSLSNFVDMKKQLIIFCDTELVPVLINQVQSGNSALVLSILKYMASKSTLDYAYSIEAFIKKLVDPGEDFPVEEKPVLRIDDFKSIFNLVRAGTESYSNETLLFLSVLRVTAYYILDEPEVQALYSRSVQTLHKFVDGAEGATARVAISLEIFQALHQYLGGAEGVT